MPHHYALFSAHYHPHKGGIESFTKSIAHALVLEGNAVTVVTSHLDASSPVCEVQDDGVEVVRLPCHALMNERLPISRKTVAYRELLAVLRGSGIDRVLVNARFYRHSLEGLRFASQIEVPAVVLDHGSAYLVLGNGPADAALRAYEHTITNRGKRFGARYSGVSNASARWLETFGIHTNFVIPNAIDAQAYRESASSRNFRAELGMSDDQLLIVFAGRLTPEKGALELAQAIEMLDDRFACAMAGEGFLRKDIEALGCSRVHLLGMLEQPDLSALLAQGDAFCLPTRSEGFCTSLLEAGAWGLTPLMPRVGGVDEVMGDPVRFGRLLDDRSPATIASTLSDMAAAHETGQSEDFARYVAENHSWQASVRALEQCFDA